MVAASVCYGRDPNVGCRYRCDSLFSTDGKVEVLRFGRSGVRCEDEVEIYRQPMALVC